MKPSFRKLPWKAIAIAAVSGNAVQLALWLNATAQNAGPKISEAPPALAVSPVEAIANLSDAGSPVDQTEDSSELMVTYEEMIAQLRAAGVAEALVQRVVIADLEAAHEERMAVAAERGLPSYSDYWISDLNRQHTTEQDDEEQKAFWQSSQQLRDETEKVLGVSYDEFQGRSFMQKKARQLAQSIPTLDQSRLEQMAEVDKRYERILRLDESGAEGRKRIHAQRSQALKALLNPAEQKLYDYCASPLSDSLRYDLAILQPSRQEFEAIFELRRSIVGNEQESSISRHAEAAYQQGLQQILGAERYQNYVAIQDVNYRRIAYELKRMNAALDQAPHVLAVVKQSADEMERINTRVAGRARETQLEEAREKLAQNISRLTGLSAEQVHQTEMMWIE
jgi:hypothetical protein